MTIDVLKTLQGKIDELGALIQNLQTRLKDAPAGVLLLKTSNGHQSRYLKCETMETLEYLGKDKEPLVKALSQKKYDQGLLKVATRQKAELERTLERLSKGNGPRTLDDVMSTMPESLKRYITLDPATNEGFIAKWSQPSPKRFYKGDVPKESPHYTMRGEHVRSKSEILIADRLYARGVPYHYELAFSPNEGVSIRHPDFTVLNTRTLEEFYWEHLGKMDDPKYSVTSKEKVEWFAAYGIVPGRRLIVTFETSMNPLNTRYVDRLIDLYLK